jgi:hypothetical protein
MVDGQEAEACSRLGLVQERRTELGVLTGTKRPSELPPLFPGIWSPRDAPRNDLETPLVVYCRHVVGRSLVGSTGPRRQAISEFRINDINKEAKTCW